MENTLARNTGVDAPDAADIAREIQAFRDNLESTMSFVYAHPGGVLDFRPMADGIRYYLDSDEARHEDYRKGVDDIRKNWLSLMQSLACPGKNLASSRSNLKTP